MKQGKQKYDIGDQVTWLLLVNLTLSLLQSVLNNIYPIRWNTEYVIIVFT